MPGLRPGSSSSPGELASFRRAFGKMVGAPEEDSLSEKPPPAPVPPTQQVVVNRFVIEPLPLNIRAAIATRRRTTARVARSQQSSYYEGEGYMENEDTSKGSSSGKKFAKLLVVVALSIASSVLPLIWVLPAYEKMVAIDAMQKPPQGGPSDIKPHDVPAGQRAPSFPLVRSYPCTSGSPTERHAEGYGSAYQASGGFEVYAGCAWVIVPFATYNIQMERNVRLEHPESGQSCVDATSCVGLLNRVWQQAGDKRVRVFVPRGGELMHWGQKP